jgi:hypothetical protein
MDPKSGHDKPHIAWQTAGKRQKNEINVDVVIEGTLHTLALSTPIALIKSEEEMNTNNLSLVDELSLAFSKQHLPCKEPENKDTILSKIKSTFVKGNPRAWWLSFSKTPIIQVFDDNSGHLHLSELAPANTKDIWLIVDEDNESKLIFSAPLEKVPNILEDCRYFEYYLVNKELTWILAENDHGDLLFSEKLDK